MFFAFLIRMLQILLSNILSPSIIMLITIFLIVQLIVCHILAQTYLSPTPQMTLLIPHQICPAHKECPNSKLLNRLPSSLIQQSHSPLRHSPPIPRPILHSPFQPSRTLSPLSLISPFPKPTLPYLISPYLHPWYSPLLIKIKEKCN